MLSQHITIPGTYHTRSPAVARTVLVVSEVQGHPRSMCTCNMKKRMPLSISAQY